MKLKEFILKRLIILITIFLALFIVWFILIMGITGWIFFFALVAIYSYLKRKEVKEKWLILIGSLIFLAIYTILTHMCMNPFDIRHIYPEYFDGVSFSAPEWISNDELIFIKTVTHRSQHPPFMTNDGIWGEERDDYLCTIKIDGTDKREIVRVEDGEQLDYCPANKKVAYVYKRFIEAAYGRWDYEIWTVNIDGTDKKRVAVSDGLHTPSWSPDGSKIAYGGGGIWVMDEDGGNKKMISPEVKDYNPKWSPDGTKIALNHGDSIWIMNPDGTGRRMVRGGEVVDWWDNNKIITTIDEIIDLNGTIVKKLPEIPLREESWSPDRRKVAGFYWGERTEKGVYPKGVYGIYIYDFEEKKLKKLLLHHSVNYGRRIVGTFRFKKSGVW